jgi:hypothetical protein
MNRPPATRWKTYTTVPAEGIATGNPAPGLHLLGVVFHGAGTFAAVPTNPETADTAVELTVKADQFWGLDFTKITSATTALPLTVLWGPHR